MYLFCSLFQYMATDQSDVYAAGDIVEFPLFTTGSKNANVQHWQMAHAHGMYSKRLTPEFQLKEVSRA